MFTDINNTFYLFIFIVLMIVVIIEIVSIDNYRTNCQTDKRAIARLIEFYRGKQNYIKIEQGEAASKWIIRHLKGESLLSAFTPERSKNDDLILLSYPSTLAKPVPRSPVTFAPALLTAIGILGTFWGIFRGLQGVDLENISDPQQLIEASQVLLSGMKTSFATSLVGLGTAIFFMIFLSLVAPIRNKTRNGLRKKLSDIAFLESPNRLLSRLDNDGNIEVAKTLQTVADNLSGLNAEVIASAVKSAIASPNSPLVLELKQLRELQESQGQTVESLVRQLRNELIEPVVTRLDQSAELTKQASEAVTGLKNELGDISQSLAGAVTTIQSFQQDTLTKLQDFTTELRNILSKFQTDTKDVLEGVASEINRAVEQSIQGMEQQRTIFKENADEVSATFENIHGIIRDTNQVVQQELEVFRKEYQERLQEFLGNQHHELQTIVEQIGKVFQEDVARRERLIEQIEQSMDKIQQTVKATSNLANAIGLSDSQRLAEQQSFFREIGHSANQVTKQYSTMVKRLDEALNLSNEKLNDYLSKANETYTRSIQDADKAAAKVCIELNETSHGLMNVANFLVTAANDLNNSNEGR